MQHLRPISEAPIHVGDLRFVVGIVDGVEEWCGVAVCEETLHVLGVYARKYIAGQWRITLHAPDRGEIPTHYDPDVIPLL